MKKQYEVVYCDLCKTEITEKNKWEKTAEGIRITLIKSMIATTSERSGTLLLAPRPEMHDLCKRCNDEIATTILRFYSYK